MFRNSKNKPRLQPFPRRAWFGDDEAEEREQHALEERQILQQEEHADDQRREEHEDARHTGQQQLRGNLQRRTEKEARTAKKAPCRGFGPVELTVYNFFVFQRRGAFL